MVKGDHFFGLSDTKVGLITFLIPGSGSCLLSMRSYRQKQTLGLGQLRQQLLGIKDERRVYGGTCKTTSTRIDDDQDIKECAWLY
jgi:hypothetical protein